MDRALYDFAEAAMGRNTDMSWSLSEAVLRRQVSPVFSRCADGDLTADQALDVALDFVTVRVANTLEVFNNLFQILEFKIGCQMPGHDLPALGELQEFFMGLNVEVQWAIDESISHRELFPLFVRVAAGTLSPREGIGVFCDTIDAKKEYILEMVHGMCLRLTEQIIAVQTSQRMGNGDAERLTNGDE